MFRVSRSSSYHLLKTAPPALLLGKGLQHLKEFADDFEVLVRLSHSPTRRWLTAAPTISGGNMYKLLLLSGAIGAGKSSVATEMEVHSGFRKISSSGYLRAYGQRLFPAEERHQLQELGDRLDRETDFQWIVKDVAVTAIEDSPYVENWLLDAVRKPRQVEHFRDRFGHRVRHIHLIAPETLLRERYVRRADANDTSYDQAVTHPNEVAARSLESIADGVFDTSRLTPTEIAHRVMNCWATPV